MSNQPKVVEKKKKVYSFSSSENYDWANLEVRRLSSIYTSTESVNKLRSQLLLSSHENAERIIIEPCPVGEPVCFSPPQGEASPEFFYMYETLFSRLNIKLPFSTFECDVLRTLNIAPSQLHPNGWAYVRAFELLCRNYDINPSAPLLLCFFKRQLSNKGWVSLNAIQGKSILSLFTSNYKYFKTKYFRVKNSEDFPELIKDDSGGYKFPLYWSPNPSIRGTDQSSLTPIERAHAHFLESFPITLRSSAMINLGNKPAALREYLDNMIPVKKQELSKQSEPPVRKIFSIKRKWTSENVAEVSTPSTSRSSSQKSSSETCESESSETCESDSSETCESEKWQSVLQKCENEVVGELPSLWDKQFPIPDLIDKCFSNREDVEKVKNLNSQQISRALETYTVQSAFLARSLEKEWKQYEKDLETFKRSNEELKGQLDKAKNAEKDLDDLRKKFCSLEAENIKKDLKIKELEEEKKKLVTSFETGRDEFKVAYEKLMRSLG